MQQDITTDTPQIPLGDLMVAKRMADTLHKAYPGHLWAVTVDGAQGMATVRNLSLSGQWGFYVKLAHDWSASNFEKQVKMAGGELLERYKVRRERANNEELAALPVNYAGRHIADHG